MPLQDYSIPACAAVAALDRNKVDHVITVPDWVQLSLHGRLGAGVDGIRVIACANENQTVTVAAGLTIGGKRPILMMQNQGLYNCIKTVREICLDANFTHLLFNMFMLYEYSNFGRPATESRRSMVRIMEPLLTSIGVPFHCLDNAADLVHMDTAYEQAERERTAVVLLVSAPMAWN